MKRFGLFLSACVVALVAVALVEAQGPGPIPPPQGPMNPGILPFKLKPDLTITKLKATRHGVKVTVKNQGKKASGATTVRVELLRGRNVLVKHSARLPALKPGQTTTMTVHLEHFGHHGQFGQVGEG